MFILKCLPPSDTGAKLLVVAVLVFISVRDERKSTELTSQWDMGKYSYNSV